MSPSFNNGNSATQNQHNSRYNIDEMLSDLENLELPRGSQGETEMPEERIEGRLNNGDYLN